MAVVSQIVLPDSQISSKLNTQTSMSEAQHQYATYHDLPGKRVLVTGKISCMLLFPADCRNSHATTSPAPGIHLLMCCTL